MSSHVDLPRTQIRPIPRPQEMVGLVVGDAPGCAPAGTEDVLGDRYRREAFVPVCECFGCVQECYCADDQ